MSYIGKWFKRLRLDPNDAEKVARKLAKDGNFSEQIEKDLVKDGNFSEQVEEDLAKDRNFSEQVEEDLAKDRNFTNRMLASSSFRSEVAKQLSKMQLVWVISSLTLATISLIVILGELHVAESTSRRS